MMTTPFKSLGTEQDPSQALFFGADSLNLGDEFFSAAVESARINTVASRTLSNLPRLPEEFTWEELPSRAMNVLQPPTLEDPDFLRIIDLNRAIIEKDARENFNRRDVAPAETDLEEEIEDSFFLSTSPLPETADGTVDTPSPSEQELDLSCYGADSIFSTPTPETVDEIATTPSPSEQGLDQSDLEVLDMEDPLSSSTPTPPIADETFHSSSPDEQEPIQSTVSAEPSPQRPALSEEELNTIEQWIDRNIGSGSIGSELAANALKDKLRDPTVRNRELTKTHGISEKTLRNHRNDLLAEFPDLRLLLMDKSGNPNKKRKAAEMTPAIRLEPRPLPPLEEIEEWIDENIAHETAQEVLKKKLHHPDDSIDNIIKTGNYSISATTVAGYRCKVTREFPRLRKIWREVSKKSNLNR